MERDALNAARRLKYSENRESEKSRLRQWRESHPDLVRGQKLRAKAARKERYPAQREAIQERIRTFRAQNPDKVREYNKKAYIKHRGKVLIRAAEYQKSNPHVAIATAAKRRASKMDAPLGDLALITHWQKLIRALRWVRCHWCGTKVYSRKIHFDHVTPLSKGGAHSIANICASCPDCNHRKSARLIADWIVADQSFLNLA